MLLQYRSLIRVYLSIYYFSALYSSSFIRMLPLKINPNRTTMKMSPFTCFHIWHHFLVLSSCPPVAPPLLSSSSSLSCASAGPPHSWAVQRPPPRPLALLFRVLDRLHSSVCVCVIFHSFLFPRFCSCLCSDTRWDFYLLWGRFCDCCVIPLIQQSVGETLYLKAQFLMEHLGMCQSTLALMRANQRSINTSSFPRYVGISYHIPFVLLTFVIWTLSR